MKRYQCHKVVEAGGIVAIDPVCEGGPAEITLDDGQVIDVDATWMKMHKPEVGGFYVVYPGGYVSYSPADPFIGGYTEVDAAGTVIGPVQPVVIPEPPAPVAVVEPEPEPEPVPPTTPDSDASTPVIAPAPEPAAQDAAPAPSPDPAGVQAPDPGDAPESAPEAPEAPVAPATSGDEVDPGSPSLEERAVVVDELLAAIADPQELITLAKELGIDVADTVAEVEATVVGGMYKIKADVREALLTKGE